MTITITGATGQLGRLVVPSLLARGVPAGDVVALGRDAERLASLAELGVRTRAADYDDAASLDAALAGTDRLLLISGTAVGEGRTRQHQAVIDAAGRAGVGQVAYTSIAGADASGMRLAEEHTATERALAASGIDVVLLRNSWYIENWSAQLETQLASGVVAGASGDGRVSVATRADYAEAAAAVLTQDGHAGRTYELGGDTAISLPEYAETIARLAGQPVRYQDLPEQEYAQLLESFGVPPTLAGILADSDTGIARGELLVSGDDLSGLIGHPTTTPQDHLRDAVDRLHAAV